MSRETFHESLERIEMELLSMGELASNSVQTAVDALVQHDDAKAQGVIDEDDLIDEQVPQDRLRESSPCWRCSRRSPPIFA